MQFGIKFGIVLSSVNNITLPFKGLIVCNDFLLVYENVKHLLHLKSKRYQYINISMDFSAWRTHNIFLAVFRTYKKYLFYVEHVSLKNT